jgi:hypothetical protein
MTTLSLTLYKQDTFNKIKWLQPADDNSKILFGHLFPVEEKDVQMHRLTHNSYYEFDKVRFKQLELLCSSHCWLLEVKKKR